MKEISDKIEPQNHLLDLAAGDVPFIRVREFVACNRAGEILNTLRHLLSVQPHPYFKSAAIGVEFLGLRYSSAFAPEKKDEYFERSQQVREALETAAGGNLSFLQTLLDYLSSIWPAGCQVATMQGKSMAPCAIRMVQDGAAIEPHQDETPRTIDQLSAVKCEPITLAINLFFQTSGSGGELEVWNLGYEADDYKKLQMQGSYALDRNLIPQPNNLLAPLPGDLVILNATRLHAVRRVQDGCRCTMSCFLALTDLETPLIIWA